MRRPHISRRTGFTFTEAMVAMGIGSVILGATLTASIGLQKSFNAVDNYFGTHMQQIRIIDYLNRDVKRALSVTTSIDLQTVTVIMPNYLIKAGDLEAVGHPELVGTRRSPTIVNTPSGPVVYYGTPPKNDGVIVVVSGVISTLLSPTSIFNSSIVNYPIAGSGLPPGTTATYASPVTLTLTSPNFTTVAVGVLATFTLYRNSTVVYSISNQSILRTEDGAVTTIASSTDQLVPLTTDVELANTEYTNTTVAFQPIFTSGGNAASRTGTTLYSTAYLRNKRRPLP